MFSRQPVLIAGLGNPGPAYAKSRHNVGFRCVDRLANAHGLKLSRYQSRAALATGTIAGRRVILSKPLTYMNLSGQSVAALVRFYKVELHDILIVYDDLDLPLGRLRLRPAGGAGGHKGMTSVIQALGTEAVPRLRIGIGRPDNDEAVDFVLGPFTPEEETVMAGVYDQAVEAILVFLQEGIESAMTRFN